MKPGGGPASLGALKRRALSLGAVKAFDHAVQFLLPVLLVRCLDAETFGEYRLFWLTVGTVMTFATLNMCGTLFFFVPRSEPGRRRLYIHQSMLYLVASGLVCAFLVSPANPLLPPAMAPLGKYGFLVPALVGLWVLGALLDRLPAVDERISWQASVTVVLTTLRVVLMGAAAWITGDLAVMLALLLAVVILKLALLFFYVGRHHGLGRPWFQWSVFSDQFRHSAPLGLNSTFFGLRGKADQWVAASLFSLASFAAFSIAALVGHLMHIVRSAVMEAFLPSMSRLHAAGDTRGMLKMNSRGNVIIGKLFYPMLAFAFVFAPEIITLIYTASYAEAAPVVRVYLVGMVAAVVEMGSMVMLLRQGPFAVRVTAFSLALSVAASWTGAHLLGLPGAAIGSVLGVYVDRLLILGRISRLTGIKLRRLQDWKTLAMALALAAVSGALAWVLVDAFLPERGSLVRLLAGAAVCALAYGAAHLGGERLRARPREA
jgi:O-antigen/teichoic acid export membrane protein